MYFEDLKEGSNNDIGPKGFFEIGSNLHLETSLKDFSEILEFLGYGLSEIP